MHRPVATAPYAIFAPAAHAATGSTAGNWLAWIVVGAVVLLLLGIVLRMIVAARFPKGYRAWAAQRRESFDANNDAWDRADEEFRR